MFVALNTRSLNSMELVANILGFFATLVGVVKGHAGELPKPYQLTITPPAYVATEQVTEQ